MNSTPPININGTPKTPSPTRNIRLPSPSPTTKQRIKEEAEMVERIKNTLIFMETLNKQGEASGPVNYRPWSILQIIPFITILSKNKNNCIITDKQLMGIRVSCSDMKCSLNHKLFNNAKKIAKDILECIKQNNKIIIIYLTILHEDIPDGHANILIYRPDAKRIERFEPHGAEYGVGIGNENKVINNVLRKLFEDKMKQCLGDYTPKYYSPEFLCPYRYGFQTLEEQMGLDKFGNESIGFCGMWSLFIMELILLNPNSSTEEIIEIANLESSRDPAYLKNLIRGYTLTTEHVLDKVLKFLSPASSFKYGRSEDILPHMGKIRHQLMRKTKHLSVGRELLGEYYIPKTLAELRESVLEYMEEKKNGMPHVNGDISSWNVSKITDMSHLFKGITEFNEPLGNWDVSKVTNMSHMFDGCVNYNQDMSNWDTRSVKDMSYMFNECKRFNQNIEKWNTYLVENMEYMFCGCDKYNGQLNSWLVYNVNNTTGMFKNCLKFNQYLGRWGLIVIKKIDYMFYGCKSFSKELPWKQFGIGNLAHDNMFTGSKTAFDQSIKSLYVLRSRDELRSAVVNYVEEKEKNKQHIKGDINNWDVARITDMTDLLLCHPDILIGKQGDEYNMLYREIEYLQKFNEYINDWNVMHVITMENMFLGCKKFNQPLNNWNVENVKNMDQMFAWCMSFTQKLKWKKYNIDKKSHTDMFKYAGITYKDAIIFDTVDTPENTPVSTPPTNAGISPKKKSPTPPHLFQFVTGRKRKGVPSSDENHSVNMSSPTKATTRKQNTPSPTNVTTRRKRNKTGGKLLKRYVNMI